MAKALLLIKPYIEKTIKALNTSTYTMLIESWEKFTGEIAAPEMILLKRYLAVLDIDQVVCVFDRKLITDLLNHQLEVL